MNCTSKASKPAADIFWFINGEPVRKRGLTRPLLPNHDEPSIVHLSTVEICEINDDVLVIQFAASLPFPLTSSSLSNPNKFSGFILFIYISYKTQDHILFKADESLIHAYPIQNTSRDLHTSTVGLRFKVEPEHFSERGDMKLKCTATIASIYWKSNEKSAENIKQKRDFQSLYEAPPGRDIEKRPSIAENV